MAENEKLHEIDGLKPGRWGVRNNRYESNELMYKSKLDPEVVYEQ